MASTAYGVNHDLAVKLWAKSLMHEALKETTYGRLMGTSPNSVIQIKSDLNKGAGDRIRFGLRMQLTGDGIQADGILEGNEESLVTYTDNVFVNQLRHAVISEGEMTQQRVPFSIRQEARMGLADWWADRWDTWVLNQLGGNTGQADTRYTGHQATVAPSSDHIIYAGGDDSEASISTTATFNLNHIDECVEKAKTLTPMIRKANIGGRRLYVMIMHPYQAYDLRTNTATGQWLDISKSFISGGAERDRFGTNALGIYRDTLLLEDTRVPSVTTNVHRAVFCGAQAGAFAFGQKNQATQMSWVEEAFDYQNKLGVSAGHIGGLKKCVFNSADFATIVVSTYSIAHTSA